MCQDVLMDTSLFAELQALIARHALLDGVPLAAFPNVTIMAADAPTPPLPHVAEPMFALVAQGTKRIGLDKKVFDYGAGQYLIISVDLPLDAHVVRRELSHGLFLALLAVNLDQVFCYSFHLRSLAARVRLVCALACASNWLQSSGGFPVLSMRRNVR